MRVQLARLVTNRTSEEYIGLENYLKDRLKEEEFDLSMKVSMSKKSMITGAVYERGESYYRFKTGEITIIAKRANELKEKVEIYCKSKEIWVYFRVI